MFRIAVFIFLLFVLAFGFAWLADNPGTVTVQWDWLNEGQAYEIDLITLSVIFAVVILVAVFSWWIVSGVIHSPEKFGRWRAGRRRDRGYSALSRGLVAAGAGNISQAKQLAKESHKFLEDEPLVAMLEAQTALMEDDSKTARERFNTMLQRDETRLLGLRGLYHEAEKEGAVEAASHFANEAYRIAPGTRWAANAVLKMQTIAGQWQEALKTIDQKRAAGLFSKQEHARKRAVVLTALALQNELPEPEQGRANALAACKLAPDLVPAATVAARLLVRLNDVRKAGKILEAAWRLNPHPEIADAYVSLISGATATDRLKRAEKLAQKAPDSRDGQIAIAKAAIDTGDFSKARDAMAKVLAESASEQACLLMADIEEAEHGDRGRVREWLSRAVSAARDPAWIADGVIVEQWAPCSADGRLDAFEWKTPLDQLGVSKNVLDLSKLAREPLMEIEASKVSQNPSDEQQPAPPEKVESRKDGSEATGIEEAEIVSSASNPPENDNEEPTQQAEKIYGVGQAAAGVSVGENTESDKSAEAASARDGGNEPESGKESDVKKGATRDRLPYGQNNLDADQDGIIDHRPDDPGIDNSEDAVPPKKGWLF